MRHRAERPVSDGDVPPRPVVTLAAYYGAGGHVVGPRVAERLGVELLDLGRLLESLGPGSRPIRDTGR